VVLEPTGVAEVLETPAFSTLRTFPLTRSEGDCSHCPDVTHVSVTVGVDAVKIAYITLCFRTLGVLLCVKVIIVIALESELLLITVKVL